MKFMSCWMTGKQALLATLTLCVWLLQAFGDSTRYMLADINTFNAVINFLPATLLAGSTAVLFIDFARPKQLREIKK